MRKSIAVVSTIMCIALCMGFVMQVNAVEARYLACPDWSCGGMIVDSEISRTTIYEEPQHCKEHSFCQTQVSYILQYMQAECNECGYIMKTWSNRYNYQTTHSNPSAE